MHTYLVYALLIIFLFMGVMGYQDIKNKTYDGYSSSDFTITKVEEGGPAAKSEMMVGDQIISIDSLNIRDTKAWSDKARRTAGETRTYIVNRNGEEVTYPMTYVSQTGKNSIIDRLGWTIGLIFLLLAFLVFSSKKTWSSFLFAMFCIGFAGSFLGGPHIANNMLDDIVDTMRFSFLLLSFAFLVDFLLHFPKKSSYVSSANASKKLYGPPVFLILFFTAINILQADASSGLNIFIRFAMLAFIVIYFGWALLIMFRNYRNASSEEKTNGMSLMFWGTVLGLVPILIVFIVGSLMPTVSIPGEDYMFLIMVLIPICFALAINKSE